ncbi:hypothetical protein HGP16_05180 [Rhizobium sp. P40RR-XXII]|nr:MULTISPECIES: hypothetical protein [unclassified Rhizobium]NLR83535.1 hypothetical protein [Rhizobium sp. P28RR-XV]NLS15955.1 hypothetical protein [Rhizobium sp. P40RR-XXII]
MTVLFAQTGSMQEVTVGSGWSKEFMQLPNRFDRAISNVIPGAHSAD